MCSTCFATILSNHVLCVITNKNSNFVCHLHIFITYKTTSYKFTYSSPHVSEMWFCEPVSSLPDCTVLWCSGISSTRLSCRGRFWLGMFWQRIVFCVVCCSVLTSATLWCVCISSARLSCCGQFWSGLFWQWIFCCVLCVVLSSPLPFCDAIFTTSCYYCFLS